MFCDVMIIVFLIMTTLRDRYVLSHFFSRKRLGCRVYIRIRGTNVSRHRLENLCVLSRVSNYLYDK